MMQDEEDERLDAEYRQILYLIKLQINKINNCYKLHRYRVWLERLSVVYPSEKQERNRFLLELAHQVHDNIVRTPFTHDPPHGHLPTLKSYQQRVLNPDLEHISDHFFHYKSENKEWPYVSSPRCQTTQPKVSAETEPKNIVSQKKKSCKSKVEQPFEQLGKVNKNDLSSNNSSWVDLSDSTQVEDTDDSSTLSVKHKEQALKVKQHFAKKYQESDKARKEQNKDENQTSDNNEKSENNSSKLEVEALKMRMNDLLEVKNALKDTHCLTENRKKTVDTLHMKLSQIEQEKAEIQRIVESQKQELSELNENKSKEFVDFKERFTLLRRKELEFLKQHHKNQIEILEQRYNVKIVEMQKEISGLETQYKEKIDQLNRSNFNLLKDKEIEIRQLRSQLQIKNNVPSNEGSGEQVVNLKRCISKLGKVLHRSEQDYSKEIEKLKKELKVKDLVNQMDLQSQKADLIMNNSALRQAELNEALSSLEAKYKKMVEDIQIHAEKVKRNDSIIIEELKSILRKHNIAF